VSKMLMRAGMLCLEESRPKQRTIAKETLDAWDDVIHPNILSRMMTCNNWPTNLKCDRLLNT